MNSLFFFPVCVILALLLVCIEAATAAASNEPREGEPGASLYRAHCAACHGDRGNGDTRGRSGLNPPPRDFTSPQSTVELTRERMISSVTHGRPGTAMVSFASRLSTTQIAAVVDYIRVNFMKPVSGTERIPLAAGRGAEIYAKNCSVCHGDGGNGAVWARSGLNPPPRDFTTLLARTELTQERMITSVTYGRSGTAMMAFKSRLSEQDIYDVVSYIRSTFMQVNRQQSGTSLSQRKLMSEGFPSGLKGNRRRGQVIYETSCFNCHGLNGDGEGPRAAFINPRPRNFLGEDAHTRLNRPALFEAISHGLNGTVMPAWNKVLSDQQIADVAEYVFTTFIQGISSGQAKGSPSHKSGAKKKVITN